MIRTFAILQQMPQMPQTQQYQQQGQEQFQQYQQQQFQQNAQPASQYPQQGQQPGQQMPQQSASQAVKMGALIQWAGIAGAASGIIQGLLSLVSGFDIVGFLITLGIAAVVGMLSAILLGQFGSQIPLKATLMVKAAAFMFAINLVAGLLFGMGTGGLGLLLGILGVGIGAFAYGWLIQKKLPNLI